MTNQSVKMSTNIKEELKVKQEIILPIYMHSANLCMINFFFFNGVEEKQRMAM